MQRWHCPILPIVPVVALAVLLAGCAERPSRQSLLAPLVGANEVTLVSQMGVPNRSFQSGDIKFLAYDDRRVDVIPGTGYGGWGWGGFGGFPPEVVERVCETTFQLIDGRVQSFTLRGNSCG